MDTMTLVFSVISIILAFTILIGAYLQYLLLSKIIVLIKAENVQEFIQAEIINKAKTTKKKNEKPEPTPEEVALAEEEATKNIMNGII